MEMDNQKAPAPIKPVSVPKILTFEKRLTVILARDEDKYCAFCPDLDLVTEMESPEEALEDMVEAMKDYAEEYLSEYELYSRSPNRAHHLPYIKAIASCTNDWDIRMLVEVQYGLVQV
jgi:predicted RNase H-like HicB family nuclease